MKVIYTETVPNRVNLDHTYHSQYSLGIRPLHAEGLVLRQVKYYWIVLTRTINKNDNSDIKSDPMCRTP